MVRGGLSLALRAGLISRMLLVVGALGAAGALVAAGPAGAATSPPCSSTASFGWQGAYIETPVGIPAANGALQGEVFRPADTTAYPGRRPAIVVMHGLGDSQCGVWWAARELAGHGYSTLTFTNQNPDTDGYYANAQAAVAFLVGPANPFAAYTDPHRVGAAGHSQGAIMAALLQADPKNGVSAIVAFDNIHRWVIGDPGAALDCSPTFPEEQQIAARVPALGEAEDATCDSTPYETGADLKETGWSWWRAAGVPTEVVDLAGTTHLDWSQSANSTSDGPKLQLFAYYAQAWFDRWLLGATDAQSRLLATTVLGQPLAKLLSSHYLSGAFLPGTIDTSDLLKTLSIAPPVAPPAAPQLLRAKFNGHGRAPRRVTVELSVSQGTLRGVTVELLRGRRIAALSRVTRVTTTRRKLRLRPRHAARFAAGRYRLVIRAGRRTLVRRLVRVS